MNQNGVKLKDRKPIIYSKEGFKELSSKQI